MDKQEGRPGEAVPFIMIDEKTQNGKTTCEFKLHRQAADIFASIKHKKVAIATVAGPQRSGKSFLSNRLLKRMNGFAIGPSTMPCTKGLWIWGEPIRISDDTVLIIMDTQGLNSVQRDINIDLKIFSLSILLSSVFIYNSLGTIDEKALENMSYVLRISQNIRMKSETQNDTQIAKCFPILYWVLRDFSLDLKGQTQNDYLQMALKAVSNDQSDSKNQIRAKIRKLFTYRRCECFPRPVNEENRLAHIEDLKFEELRDKFKDKMVQFQRRFYENLPVKAINGKAITGGIFLNLVRQYLETMNSGKVIEVMKPVRRAVESEARQVMENLMSNYREAMGRFSGSAVDQTLLLRNHVEFRRKIEQKLDERLRVWFEMGWGTQTKARLMDNLEKDYKERIKNNSLLCDKICHSEFTKLFTPFFELPSMEGQQLIPDGYFKQKFTDLTRKMQAYLQATKAPRKYIYFMEKFPKAAFQFMELFFARARGVYNGQMNRMKAEGRNHQMEIQSLNRIMHEQEALLSQKQKEVEAVEYQKDTLRKEHEKNEKMKQFEEQTNKMSKNEAKKTLQIYKEQIIELQHENEELIVALNKAKAQLSNQQKEMRGMVKNTGFEGSTEATQEDQNLPSELVGTLRSLQERLNHMKTFYTKNTTDQSWEESMERQLEEERTDKHREIDKVKEKLNQKIADLRQKANRNQQTNDQNFRMMNTHIDDLKSRNMDLERQLQEHNDRRGGSLLIERKNLEEALKLKQRNIDSLKALTGEKQTRIHTLEYQLATVNSEIANLQSFKETFPFILSESLSWVLGKNNKLKHSLRTLSSEQQKSIKRVFKDLSLNPF